MSWTDWLHQRQREPRARPSAPAMPLCGFPEEHYGTVEGVISARRVVARQTPLLAPISGRACVYYRFEVSSHFTVRMHEGSEKLFDEERAVPFLLQHGDDEAWVEVPEAPVGQLRVIAGAHRTTSEEAGSDEERRLLLCAGYDGPQSYSNGFGGIDLFRYTFGEQVLIVGQRVAVTGRGSHPATGYRVASASLVLRPDTNRGLVLNSLP